MEIVSKPRINLNPCPFCGENSASYSMYENEDGNYQVQCWNCGAIGPPDCDENIAVSRWNEAAQHASQPTDETGG